MVRVRHTFRAAALVIASATWLSLGSVALAQAQSSPAGPEPTARDGQSLATQTFATQAMFVAVWGTQAGQEWVTEHNAQVASLPPPPPPPPAPAPVAPPPPPPAPVVAAPAPSTSSSTSTSTSTSGLAPNGSVQVTVVQPSAGQVMDIHTAFSLIGFAYQASGAPLNHVEVYANTTYNSPSPVDLGSAILGSSAGMRPPAGYPSGSGFTIAINPQVYPPYESAPNGQYSTIAWPTGGNVLNVVAYGSNGAIGTASVPIVLQ